MLERARKPNLLLIGAQKAATTSFADELVAAGLATIGAEKEPNDLNRYSASKLWSFNYTRKYRNSSSDHPFVLDASTTYSMRQRHPDVARSAYDYLGSDTRVIYVVRDPLERAISHHKHFLRRGLAPASFEAAIGSSGDYLFNSLYHYQLQPWHCLFGHERLHIVVFEEFIAERTKSLKETFEFLGIPDAVPSAEPIVSNTASEAEVNHASLAGRVVTSRAYRDGIRNLLPKSLRQYAKIATSKPANNEPEPLCHEILDSVRSLFSSDASRLTEAYGVQTDRWQL